VGRAQVTPAGGVAVTVIGALNPPLKVNVIVSEATVEPGEPVKEAGEKEKLKSPTDGVGGGGGPTLLPPPQPVIRKTKKKQTSNRKQTSAITFCPKKVFMIKQSRLLRLLFRRSGDLFE
jgi:hypothetical protein